MNNMNKIKAALDSLFASMVSEISVVESEISRLAQQRNEEAARLAILIDESKKVSKQTSESISLSDKKAGDAKKLIDEAEIKISAAKDAEKKSADHIAALVETRGTLEARIADLKKEAQGLEKIMESKANLETVVESLRSSLTSLSKEVDVKNKELKDIESNAAEAIKALEAEKKRIEDETQEVLDSIKRSDKNISDREAAVTRKEKDIETIIGRLKAKSLELGVAFKI